MTPDTDIDVVVNFRHIKVKLLIKCWTLQSQTTWTRCQYTYSTVAHYSVNILCLNSITRNQVCNKVLSRRKLQLVCNFFLLAPGCKEWNFGIISNKYDNLLTTRFNLSKIKTVTEFYAFPAAAPKLSNNLSAFVPFTTLLHVDLKVICLAEPLTSHL